MYSFVKERNDIHFITGLVIAVAGLARELFFTTDFNFYLNDFHPSMVDFIVRFLEHNRIITLVLSYFMLLLNAFLLEIINRRYALINTFTRLPFVLYIVFITSLVPIQYLFITQVAIFIFILAIDKVYSTHNQRKLVFNYFDAALFISVASLMYPKFIFLQSFVIVSLLFLRTFRWREWVLTLLGGLLPFLFQWMLAYAFNWQIKWNLNVFAYPETRVLLIQSAKIPVIIYWIALILLGSMDMINSIQKKKIGSRRFFLILFVLFILSFLGLFSNNVGFEVILILGIPISFLVSHYMIVTTPRRSNIFYWSTLAFWFLPILLKNLSL